MGATSPQGIAQRAMTGLAQSFGPPLAGKTLTLTTTAADQTVTLEGPATYMLSAAAACYIGLADATVAANQELLPANWQRPMATPAGGLVLHVIQVSAAGVFKASKLDDVG